MAEQKKKTVLFLGTSNRNRGRLAEIIFGAVAGKMSLPWFAASRGLVTEQGGTMDPAAVKSLDELGIRAGDAVSRPAMAVTEDDFESADRVVALNDAEHRPLLVAQFPTRVDKIEFWHVENTADAAALIEREVMNLVARILSGGNRPEGRLPTEFVGTPAAPTEAPKKSVTLKVGRETAGRKGKGVTTVFDMPLSEKVVQELAATLKNRCGTGGTVKDGRIEIQGDQRERIIAELEKLGYKVKRVGG